MVDTIKFSQMTNAGNINNNDVMPSLRGGANVILNNPWTFLPSGTTAQRPTPSVTVNYRLRFNTDIQFYEYYNAVLMTWVQLADAGFIPSALTATPDTNVTITLGGTPATALLQPASITLGWTGTLAPSRGGLGTGAAPADGQVPVGSGGNYTPTSIGSGTGILVGLGAGAINVALAPISTLNLLANITGGSAAPTPHTLSAIIDACIGSVQGDILYRGAATWSVLAPGTSGFFLQTQGAAANPQWAAIPFGSIPLTNTHIFVGNAGNIATDVPMSGDATIANTGAVTVSSIGGKAVTLGGAFTMSGAFTFTGTLTGNTAVTFPISGTLATTAGTVGTLTGDVGVATASAGNINVTGSTTGLTFTGAASTLTLGGILGLANGGTNNALTASAGGILWSDASKLNILSGTSTANQILLSGNAATPAWSTTTYPATNAINTIMYASSANVLDVITPVNTAVLVSSAGGVPSWAAQLSLSRGGTNANLTAANGAIPYSTATAFALLAPGTSGQLLQSGGAGAPSWTTTTFPSTGGVAGNILISDGANYIASTSLWPNTVGGAGTILRSNGISNAYTTSTFADTYAVSTILYASSANTVSGLATANSSVLITSAGGVPSWSTTLPSGIAATNMALTTPTIKGSNGFNVATFADVASATDYFSFTAGVANGALVQLISGSTNASFKILAKGTGGVTIGSAAATTNPMTWTNSTNTFAVSIPTWTGNRTLTLPDANVTLVSGTMLSNALTSAHIFVGNVSNVATDVAMSGDATLANTGALTIANSAVTYAKIQNVAANSVIGNATSSSAVATDVSIASIKGTSGNLIIGGEFGTNPWQRGTSFSTPTGYTADRWFITKAGGFTYSVTQDSNAPSVAVAGVKTTASYKMSFSNTVSPGSANVLGICQFIEGYRFSTIAQKTFTISFSVRASLTGTYCVAFINTGQDRSYVAEYTVNVADTWEYKTITVTPSPSAGTWNYTTGVGLEVFFTMASGTDYQTTANAWQTGFFVATSNQVTATVSGGTFYIDCVKIEDGSVATPYQIDPMSQILNDCYRYYYTSYTASVPPGTVTDVGYEFAAVPYTTGVGFNLKSTLFQESMRAAPTVTLYSPVTGASGNYYDYLGGADASGITGGIGTKSFRALANSVVVTPYVAYQYVADAEL